MPLQSDNVPQILSTDQWAGINQASTRTMVDDQQLYWLENFFPLAPGRLRSGYGPSAPIYTAPYGVNILRIFCTNIDGVNPLGFMFLSDGTVTQVNLNDGSQVGLGQVWAPEAPHYWADLKLWAPNQFGNTAGQNGGVVIGSPQGLYAWDGATLTAPGQTPPLWLTGGVTTDNSGNPLIMPVGLPGIYAIEVYKERLFVIGQTVISFSGPTNGADFSAAGGGGSFPFHGDQLAISYTDLHASSGFLYVFGDSLTDVITDLTLVGSQASQIGPLYTTQFQFNNVDPQIGQRFFRPVGVWEQAYTMFNGAGIYLLSGSQVNWVSQNIIDLIHTLDPAPFEPSQCPVHIFGKKWMLFNVMLTDPWGLRRSMILCWSGPQEGLWTVATQNLNLTEITSYEQNSVITAYGTDGAAFYQLFAQPDPALEKRVVSKLYGGLDLHLTIKNWKRMYLEVLDNMNTGPEGVHLVGTAMTGGGGIPNGVEELYFSIPPRARDTVPHPLVGKGIYCGFDLRSKSLDFTLSRATLSFDVMTLFGA